MHHHLVVEPAEDNQVFLIRLATLGPRLEMMDLETVTGVTAIGATHVVVVGEQGPPQRWWRGALLAAVVEEPSVTGPGQHLGVGVAEDRLQRLSADSRSGFEHDTSLTV